MKGIRWKVSKLILVFKPELSLFNLVSFISTARLPTHKIYHCPLSPDQLSDQLTEISNTWYGHRTTENPSPHWLISCHQNYQH